MTVAEFAIGAQVKVTRCKDLPNLDGKRGVIEKDYHVTPELCAFQDYGVRIDGELCGLNANELAPVDVAVLEGVVEVHRDDYNFAEDVVVVTSDFKHSVKCTAKDYEGKRVRITIEPLD